MRMKALEVTFIAICFLNYYEKTFYFKNQAYPPYNNQASASQDSEAYIHAQEHLDSSSHVDGFRPKIGTLSKAEWEAVCKWSLVIGKMILMFFRE